LPRASKKLTLDSILGSICEIKIWKQFAW
jgi:hypothetical protein